MKDRKSAASYAAVYGLAAVLLAGAFHGMSYAKEEREKISKVTLEIESGTRLQADGEGIMISSDSGSYTIEGYDVLNAPDSRWSSYDCPRIMIHLYAEEDYYFKSQSSGYFTLKGDVYRFVDAEKGSDGGSMDLTVDLKPMAKIGNPMDLEWSSNGTASWSKGYKATRYDVALYRDGSQVKSDTVTGQSYNFSDMLTGDYSFTFKVRSRNSGDLYSNWVESDGYTGHEAADKGSGASSGGPSGGWVQDARGWWYKNQDSTWPAAAWKELNGVWYYFGPDGYMLTGFQNINEKFYYFNGDGAMQTGPIQVDGASYYFGSDGAALVNAATPDGRQAGADGRIPPA